MIACIARTARIAWIAQMYGCMSRLGYRPMPCASYAAAQVLLCAASSDMHPYACVKSHASLCRSPIHSSHGPQVIMYAREQEGASASGQCPPRPSRLTRKRLLRGLTCVCSRDPLPRTLSGCSSPVPWPLSSAVASHLLWALICSCLSCAVASLITSHHLASPLITSCLSHPLLWCLSTTHVVSCVMLCMMLSTALHPAPHLPRLVLAVQAVPCSARSPLACLPAV